MYEGEGGLRFGPARPYLLHTAEVLIAYSSQRRKCKEEEISRFGGIFSSISLFSREAVAVRSGCGVKEWRSPATGNHRVHSLLALKIL